MSNFPLHTQDSAPQAAQGPLEAVLADFGMIPNLERILASAPPALEGYAALWALFEKTSFSPMERQIVYQTANAHNGCLYCLAWHTLLAQKAGIGSEDLAALRRGEPLSVPKWEALRLYTKALLESHGHPSPREQEAFYAAGYTPAQSLEVVLGLATKVLSNYTNGIAKTPLDDEVGHLAVTQSPSTSPRPRP